MGILPRRRGVRIAGRAWTICQMDDYFLQACFGTRFSRLEVSLSSSPSPCSCRPAIFGGRKAGCFFWYSLS